MADLDGWVVSPAPYPTIEKPWVTSVECVHRFNALYSAQYGCNREAIPLSDYLASVDDTERTRVMEIVEWQPPKHRWED